MAGSASAGQGGERSRAARLADRLTLVFGVVSACLLMAMMLVTSVDVAGRYLFNRPLPGGFELTEVMLACLIFAGLPIVCRQEGHVTVTILSDRLRGRARSLHAAAINLVGAGVLGVMCWRLALRAERMFSFGDVTAFLRIPMGPVGVLMTVLAGIGAAILLANAVAHLSNALRTRAP